MTNNERKPYPKANYKTFEMFKNLIKKNHNRDIKHISICTELKSETDPLIKIFKKLGFDVEYWDILKPESNRPMLPIFYDISADSCKTFYNGNRNQNIDLSDDELKTIFSSAIDVYENPINL